VLRAVHNTLQRMERLPRVVTWDSSRKRTSHGPRSTAASAPEPPTDANGEKSMLRRRAAREDPEPVRRHARSGEKKRGEVKTRTGAGRTSDAEHGRAGTVTKKCRARRLRKKAVVRCGCDGRRWGRELCALSCPPRPQPARQRSACP
jgi:hypothetical protein